jgi:hypothetical protein
MKATGPVMSATQHPFGDPNATQYHRREELLRELQMRETREMSPVQRQGPVSGEIVVAPPPRHGWTVFAAILLVVALAACLGIALT